MEMQNMNDPKRKRGSSEDPTGAQQLDKKSKRQKSNNAKEKNDANADASAGPGIAASMTQPPTIPTNYPGAQQVQKAVDEAAKERSLRKAETDRLRKDIYEDWKKSNPQMGENDRPASNYLEHELREQPGILDFCRRYGAGIPRVKVDFSMEAGMKHNPRVKKDSDEVEPDILIDHEVILADENGTDIVLYIEDAMNLPWVGTEHEGLSTDDAQAPLDRLDEKYPTPAPGHSDARHKTKFQERKKYVNSVLEKPCGVSHSGFGTPEGHKDDPHLQPPYPFNHRLNLQTKGKNQIETDAVIESYRDTAPLEQTAGIIFEAFFPDKYALDKEHNDFIEAETGEHSLHFTNRKCKLTRAILRNLQAERHKDGGAKRDDMCIMFPVGDFEGGELWLPDINIRIKYRPGSLVIIPAVLLEHAIGDFIGFRSSMVFYSKSSKATLVWQNWAFMTDAERRRYHKYKLGIAFKQASNLARKIDISKKYKKNGSLPSPDPYPELSKKTPKGEDKLRYVDKQKVKFKKFKLQKTVKNSLKFNFGYVKGVPKVDAETMRIAGLIFRGGRKE